MGRMEDVLRPTPHRRESPTGNRMVRLADVPLDERLKAYQRLVPHLTRVEDAELLLSLVLDPEEKGCRVV